MFGGEKKKSVFTLRVFVCSWVKRRVEQAAVATPDFRLFGKSEEFLIAGDDLTYSFTSRVVTVSEFGGKL